MCPEEIARRLAAPFAPDDVKWKPQMVTGNRALVIAYLDARAIQDRLDEVVGVAGWQDDYQCLPDGSVVCCLRVKFGEEWITKHDVGGQSEQPDEGDRRKAAFSDALKRAAVKFGIGRYLYRLKPQWLDYDPQKKRLVGTPRMPAASAPAPARSEPAPSSRAKADQAVKDATARSTGDAQKRQDWLTGLAKQLREARSPQALKDAGASLKQYEFAEKERAFLVGVYEQCEAAFDEAAEREAIQQKGGRSERQELYFLLAAPAPGCQPARAEDGHCPHSLRFSPGARRAARGWPSGLPGRSAPIHRGHRRAAGLFADGPRLGQARLVTDVPCGGPGQSPAARLRSGRMVGDGRLLRAADDHLGRPGTTPDAAPGPSGPL